jgi:hypothetical protein
LAFLDSLTREELLVLVGTKPAVTAEDQDYFASLIEEGVVWRGVKFLVERNYAGPLLYRFVKNLPEELVPRDVTEMLRQSYLRTYQRNLEFANVIRRVQNGLVEASIEGVILRGLVLAERAYGNPALRWFSDIDLLVSRREVERAAQVLKSLGGVPRVGDLFDAYHLKHHFHIQRLLDGGDGATVELHWNLDHHYTMFTIDIEGMMERSRIEHVGSVAIRVLEPHDQLLGLCLHAVKHCPAVRHFPRSPLLARRVLLDGWLTQMVDLSMVLARRHDFDWHELATRARSWGVDPLTHSALTAASTMLGTRVPDEAFTHLCAPPRGTRFERVLTQAFLDPDRTLKPAGPVGRFSQWLLFRWRYQDDAVFHPLRLLDLANFFFPRRSDLSRWLGRRRLKPYSFWWLIHAACGTWRLFLGGVGLLGCRIVRKTQQLFRPKPPPAVRARRKQTKAGR